MASAIVEQDLIEFEFIVVVRFPPITVESSFTKTSMITAN
jgi:hypothetical protein